METATIGEIVSVSSSYTSEVNLGLDFADPETNNLKVQGYIPTAPAIQALRQIVQGLNPISKRRVHLVTGMYGTGKSHFGLVLANMFYWLPDQDLLAPFLSKLRQKDNEATDVLARSRSAIPQRFLVVILKPTADRGGFNHTLLSSLQNALRNADISFTPQTHFGEATAILDKWVEEKDVSTRLERELTKHRTDVRRLRGNLIQLKLDAYDLFREIYEALMYLPFHPEHFADPVAVYSETVKHLRSSEEYAGVFVIVDEFGKYLSEMVRDPDGREALAVQNFLEFCKRTRENQVHFLAIAHRTLADYAAGYRTQEEWKKVYGRFIESEHPLNVIGANYEIVDMISAVINVKDDTDQHKELWTRVQTSLGPIIDWVQNAQLFSNQSDTWINQSLVVGCYPLHPASTFCLPWLAQRVGQANRTAFKFLESIEPGGLNEFIGSTSLLSDSGEPNLYTPDKLITYFGQGASEHHDYRPVMIARDAALSICGSEPLAVRIVDLVAVLEIVAQPQLQPSRESLVSILATTPTEEVEVGKVLDTLVKRQVIRFREATGRYELPRRGTGEVDAHNAIRGTKGLLRESFSLVKELAKRGDLSPIVARKYEDKHNMPRSALREFVSPRHLDNLAAYRSRIESWYSPTRKRYQGDALILYVVAESEGDIEAARERLGSGTGNAQLIVAVPKRAFRASEAVLDLATIKHIRHALEFKIPDGTVDAEDLSRAETDTVAEINQSLDAYLAADNFYWYHGKDVSTSLSEGSEEALVSDILLACFNKTPVVRDEALASILRGRDTQKKYRKYAMQQLLEVDGPITIMKSGGQAHERMLRAALRDTELLEKQRDLGKAEEFELRDEAPSNSPMAEIWGYLRERLTKSSVDMNEIVLRLLEPPYGLSHQLIELLLAATLRQLKDQCVVFGNRLKALQSGQQGDLKPISLVAENIPALVSNPDDYVLVYYEVLPEQKLFLNKLIALIDSQSKPMDPGGLWERAKDALVGWYSRLPLATRAATDLSDGATTISQLLADENRLQNAKQLLSVDIPDALEVETTEGWTSETTEILLSNISPIYEELENYIQVRTLRAIEQLCDVFDTKGRTISDLDEASRRWYSELEEHQRLHSFPSDPGHLIKAVNGEGGVVERFLMELPQAMSTQPYTEWAEDSAVRAFVLQVRLAKQTVEMWTPSGLLEKPDADDDLEARAETTKNEILSLLATSGLPSSIQAQILTELLEDIQ